MVDIVPPSFGETFYYICIALFMVGFLFVAWLKDKKGNGTVKWIRDWEEY